MTFALGLARACRAVLRGARRAGALAVLAAALAPPALSGAPPRAARPATPAAAAAIDVAQVIDANTLRMFVTNVGSFACDRSVLPLAPGLEFPIGSGEFVAYAGGLWLGATVSGAPRLALAEYATEFAPGAMIGPVPDDPTKPEYKVYKLLRLYPDGATRDAALAAYVAGAEPHGAPIVAVKPDGSLSIRGDEMTWAVYNDAAPANHLSPAGGTAPLGVEVQQTTYALESSGALGRAIFIEFHLLNKGGNSLSDAFATAWLDADIGAGFDDLVGCDPSLGLGFAYNGSPSDFVYGSTPPAVGIDVLLGARAGGGTLGMTAFNAYVNGADPDAASQTYDLMRGLLPDGTPIVSPVDGRHTTFPLSGDPVAGTGWLDTNPTDIRFMTSTGPFSMAPGDEQRIAFAVVVGQGADRLASVTQLKSFDATVQQTYDQSFAALGVPPPAPPARLSLSAPRPTPCAGACTLELRAARGGEATLELLDAAGRRLERRALGWLGPGAHPVSIELGARRPGLYFVRARQGSESAVARAVVAR